MNDYKKHIGELVINIHRCDNDGNYKTGLLVDVLEGVNTLLGIQWEGNDYKTWMPIQDIALKTNKEVL